MKRLTPRIDFIKGILLVSFIAVLLYPLYLVLYVSPSFDRVILADKVRDADQVANHLASTLSHRSSDIFTHNALGLDLIPTVAAMQKDFGLDKVKIFTSSGEVLYSTDPKDIGVINDKAYFFDVVAKGETYYKVVTKDTKTLEDQASRVDVVEIYIPFMEQGRFKGAFEIYFDITGTNQKIKQLSSRLHLTAIILTLCLSIALLLTARFALRNLKKRADAEQKIITQSEELWKANSELSVLYEFSSAVTQSINLNDLLVSIIDTFAQFINLDIEAKGGIFLINGDEMKLVAHRGHTDAFLEMHKDMKVGECLCGLAAQTGELVYSSDCFTDCRHTITPPGMEKHGHIIIPLKAVNKLIGVLYLYLKSEMAVDENTRKLLTTIGNQIGIAIENAKNYEETKTLSLMDPLTGLANRRLMQITLEKSISLVNRYNRILSLIMIDIDHFKMFNDTMGHAAGDVLLVNLASIFISEIRKSGHIVRYGGEEFLVLLPESTLSEAMQVAERLRNAVEIGTDVTVSLGVAEYSKGMRSEDLINQADMALYEAKNTGRNRVVAAKPPHP